MQKVLEELKELLEKAKMTNKLNPPATPEQIAERERSLGAIIPDEIKEFLQFSDGFEPDVNFRVFPLADIKVITHWTNIPAGWLYLGDLIGDGCYMVSDENGRLIRCDTECPPFLSDLSLADWLRDRIFERIEENIDEDE